MLVLMPYWCLARASQVVIVVKDTPANAGDIRDSGGIPGLGRSPGEGNGNPLQCSCLENLLNRRACGLRSIGSQRVRHDWINNTHRFEENTEKKDNMRLASSTLQAFDKI